MYAPALHTPSRRGHGLVRQPTASDNVARRLFAALTPLHGLSDRDSELLRRAAAGHRFVRVMQPFGSNGRSLMRVALADLPATDAFVVEAASSYATDTAFQDELGALERLGQTDRSRIEWFAAILRLAESIEVICGPRSMPIHAAWTDDTLCLEIDGVVLSAHDIEHVLGRADTLQAATGRRVIVTSSARRRCASELRLRPSAR